MEKLTREEEKQLTKEEFDKYYYYLRNLYDESFVAKLTHAQRKALHPLLLAIIKLRNRMNGFKVEVIGDESTKTYKPKIFCITHIGKYDIEIVSEVIKKHYYLLSGDFENLHDTIDGTFLGINGVIYVKEDDKEDRKLVKEKMVDILKKGGNIMYFPEGTWNLSPNLPVVQCPYGIIDIAMKSDAVIIPVAIEQYDNKFIAKVGKNFDITRYFENDKIKAINDLRGVLAGLKWDIWESVPMVNRAELNENSFNEFIDERIKEWPNFGLDEFYDRVFKPKSIVTEKEVFEFMKHIEINQSNAYLAKHQDEYIKEYVKKRRTF